ncbi:TetR family transcriptional regulator, partial [Pseudomonas sp. CrR25]|nr:TetR family transcriptional regulator [Pseudomonas sp. CrR25]
HFASKEELLFEFIEEHYEAVLALFSRLPRGAAPEVSLTTLLRALLELYDQRPMHFRLAARDLNCIDLGHQARIETLRQASRQRLLQLLGYPPSTSTPLQQAAAVASMNLLELLPASLDKCPLPAKQRTALLEHLIIGAVTHTLKLLRSDSVPAQLHTR